jgi:hypothetical protein
MTRNYRRPIISCEDIATSPAGWRAPEPVTPYQCGWRDAMDGKKADYSGADWDRYYEGYEDAHAEMADDDGDAVGAKMGRNK